MRHRSMAGRILGFNDLLYICTHHLDQVRPSSPGAPLYEPPSQTDPAVAEAKARLMELPADAPADVRRAAEQALRHARQHAFDDKE